MYCDECKDQAHAEKEILAAEIRRCGEIAEKDGKDYSDLLQSHYSLCCKIAKLEDQLAKKDLQIDELKKEFLRVHTCEDGKCWRCKGGILLERVLGNDLKRKQEAPIEDPQPIGVCKRCQIPVYTEEGFCGVCGPGRA